MEFKPYEEYKEVDLPWLDRVPNHWKVDRGKNIFKQEKREVKDEYEIITCFRDGEVTLRKNRRTTGFTESLQEIGYQGIKKGDLVIHQMDSFAGAVGVSDSDGKGSPILSVCNGKKLINNYYYAFVVREMARNGFIMSLSRGIRERSTDFRFKTFSEQIYPFPPKEEQDKIVEFLDDKLEKIDRFIELREKQIELSQEEKEVLINNAVTKGIDRSVKYKDSGRDWIGEIPEHWEITRLKYVADINMGQSPSSENYNIDKQGMPFLQGNADFANINPKTNIYTTDPKKIAEKKDILISVRAPVGAKNIADKRYCIGRGLAAITAKEINLYFLWNFIDVLNKEYKYISKGSTYDSITVFDLKNSRVIIPHLSEQKQIVAYIEKETSKIDKTIDLYKKQIDLIKEYRTSLISQAVTGKIDVRSFQGVG